MPQPNLRRRSNPAATRALMAIMPLAVALICLSACRSKGYRQGFVGRQGRHPFHRRSKKQSARCDLGFVATANNKGAQLEARQTYQTTFFKPLPKIQISATGAYSV
ncbi:hypothetical protein QLH52_19010 [Methylomonas sp. OY6]|uniref:Lipoprotein n=1 Tax=Methylomonas defluvii TaxID=3045149 RepID=A0ABU4UIV2_9GAMM|nr:hypothetical protein [Methylomonas sp. OY6]MDX8129398.1 hypothetical protein [Methylomonas sp. OY6]